MFYLIDGFLNKMFKQKINFEMDYCVLFLLEFKLK